MEKPERALGAHKETSLTNEAGIEELPLSTTS